MGISKDIQNLSNMSLACQRDSYLKKLVSRVKSCDASQLSTVISGKKEKLSGFEMILEDTVLFPEGGGQPDDRGTINGIEVLRVTRRGDEAVHFLPTPLDPGSEVEVVVDWARRWDHMQQHSGQHLITAITDEKYGFPTTSWNLGEKTSFIELDTPNMTPEQMTELENMVNDKIYQGVQMFPVTYESKEQLELNGVRTRGLPADHVGAVRLVTIEGVETNMCCGTHVSSLSHLQAIKLLCIEKGKKGKVNLVFVAGNRVLNYLGKVYERERTFTSMLKGGPEQHVDLLDKLQKSCKVAQKNALTLLREMAVLEARNYRDNPQREPLLSIHRREGDNDYMNIVVNEVGDKNAMIFITTGDDKGQGLFMISGPEADITEIGPKVAALIEGKGAGKNGRYQGKANRLSKRAQAEQLILELIASKASS